MGHDDHRLFQAALREQFGIFTRKTFQYLNPTTRLAWNWHLQSICHALDRVRFGEVKRLIITLPTLNLPGPSRAGTPPRAAHPMPIIPSAPPGRCMARTSTSSTCCASG